MQKLTFFFLLLCYFSNISAEHSIVPYLTSENDTLSLIDGVVDAYNGKFVQMDKDIEVEGSYPLELLRYYDGGHNYDSEIGYGIGLSFPALLSFYPDGKKTNLYVEQRAGFAVACTVEKQKSKKKKSKQQYKGGVDLRFFKDGYTNCCEALLRGEPSLQSMQVEGDEDQFIVTLGDGTKRHYAFFQYKFPDRFYRLIREDSPNGNHKHFSYVENHKHVDYNGNEKLLFKRIWTTNPSNTLTFNWISFAYSKNLIHLKASNGQNVSYHQMKKKGKAKNSSFWSSSEEKSSECILEKVTSGHLPTCEYEPITRSHFISTLFSTKQVSRPDGRFLKIDYDDHERVKKLWTSELAVPIYTFKYHSHDTIVTDANGGTTQFFYSNRRLIKRVEPYQTQHFSWDLKGQLVRQILADADNNPVTQKDYSYDGRGNVLEAKVTGSIRENQSKDTYTIRYRYSDDGRNLLLEENHPDGHAFSYSYVPNTNLLARKLTVVDQKIVERVFNQYDSNGILTCTISDDGSGQSLEDYTDVSTRKVSEITSQLDANLPGITLPKIIREGYDDPKTGLRHILKSIERIYSHGDLLAEEKTFDAQGSFCYSLRYEYNNRRELISEIDSMGFQTIYKYDSNGNKIYEEKVGSGKQDYYVYDNANRLINESEHLKDGKVLTTTHAYDPLGNRLNTIDPFGKKTTFRYDLASRQTSVTDPLGYALVKEYDTQGNITYHTDQDGHTTKTVYNLYGHPFEINYPDGTQKRFSYNLQGYLIQEWERDGLTTQYEVDYQGRVEVARTYAPDGTLLKTLQKFYKGPQLILEIDAKGNQISYAYDAAGRQTAITQGEKTTHFEYDNLGRLSTTTTSEGIEIKEYDLLDRVVEERMEDLLGNIFRHNSIKYDIDGNCISKRNYCDHETFAETEVLYNSKHQPVNTVDAGGNQTFFSYNYSDHLEKVTLDPLSRRKVEIYDPLQRLKEVSLYSSSGQLLSHHILSYDGRGNPILQQEDILCEGQLLGTYAIVTTYDCMGQKLSHTEQNKKTTRYSYQEGRLKEIINPDGLILSHTYDSLGRLKRLNSSDGTIDYLYTYDLNDNLLKSEDIVHQTVTERSYDAFNRQIIEKQATGFEVFYSYDTLDRLKEVSFNSHKIVYDYNPSSLTSASRYQGENILYTYHQTTDWCGKTLNCELPNKTSIAYTWDLLGRSSTIDTSSFHQSAHYDAVSNLTDLTINDPLGSYTSTFSYDDLNQITSETGPFNHQYLCDSIHNRRSKDTLVNAINDLNQVTNDITFSYTYDLNGRRLTKNRAQYTYDALGRLTTFTDGDQCIHYVYDTFGRLIERNTTESKAQYLYQFDTEIASFENGQMKTFRALQGTHAPFAMELDGVLYSSIRNHRGDLCVLLADQTPVCTYRYSAFGEFLHDGNITPPWLMSGQRYDFDTELYHFAKREHDPTLGTWLTPDPLGFVDGPNLYTYVNNNPLIYTDPYGLWMEHIDFGRC
ncbi:MAG: RHS repeat-associated core domain-containing protein, partial [Parachlamydiaceae bacterium]